MSGTARTTAALLAEFPTNTTGLITPADAQDLIVSGPQWDALGGVPAPGIIHGIVDFTRYFLLNGGVLGSGQTLGQRQTNATVLQAAITSAATNGKAFVAEDPNIIEIDVAAGITIPWGTTGIVWRGSRQFKMVQFHTNAPILNIGDLTGSNNLGNNLKLDGVCAVYGVSQTGNTSAIAVRMGAWATSHIKNLVVERFAPGAADCSAYICFTNFGSFSCHFENIATQGGQLHIVDFNTQGATSGNVYSNWFATVGFLNAPVAISSWAVGCSAAMTNSTWTQLNIECVSANRILNFAACRSLEFISTHMETISLTGSGPLIFGGGQSSVKITGMTLDFRCTTVDGASVFGRLVGTFGSDNFELENITLLSQSPDSGAVNLPFYIFDAGSGVGATPDTPPTLTVRNLTVLDINAGGLASNVALDQSMPLTTFNSPQAVADYVYSPRNSRVRGAVRNVSATYTHYGGDTDATLLVPVSITSFTITLSNVTGATGTQPTTTGNTVHIRRLSGTPAGTLTVNDDSGTTLTTNTTAAADFFYVFNGTHYVAFTPVT